MVRDPLLLLCCAIYYVPLFAMWVNGVHEDADD